MFPRNDRARTRAARDLRQMIDALECRRLLSVTPTLHRLTAASVAARDLNAPIFLPANLPAQARSNVPAVSARAASAFDLGAANLRALLATAPVESLVAPPAPLTISLPTPDGTYERFAIVESSVMAPALAAQFPDIHTYAGRGVDDPTATIRLDYTPLGFHAQILSPARGAYYIDPYYLNNAAGTHVAYYRRDMVATASPATSASDLLNANAPAGVAAPATAFGGTLRTFRLAVAATAEYTAFQGGTVALGQAAVVTAVNRVDGVYETELDVRLVLVANNSSLIYTNSSTDPYTNNNSNSLLSQNQSNIDSIIGSANYDIGHVFSTAGGGLAALGVVGKSGLKAQGETGTSSPSGDGFYIDYVAHEMGHQFGANHTFNTSSDSSNRNGATAYEPGSGTTIMAYAGIEGNEDLQPHSDPFFHSASIDEIRTYLGTIGSVGTSTSTGNSAPLLDPLTIYTIPTQTPFTLTASGSDPDADPVTYEWEERDLGPANLLTSADNGTSPLFRDYAPSTDPSRTLPQLASILSGANATSAPAGGGLVERLYTVARTSHWRVLARDNRTGGGGVSSADMNLIVVNTGSAFSVTSPNTSTITWFGGDSQTVSWNVAGTTANGINAANVSILLSTDGGLSFPITLAASTPNDGSQAISVPTGIDSSTARIKISAVGNVFFDISNANFTLNSTPPGPGSIAGQTFEDRDDSATLNPGDAPLAGALVFLDTNNNTTLDPGEPSTISSASGTFSFPSVTPGTYHLRQQTPAGYLATTPPAVDVTVSSNTATTQNFGLFPYVYGTPADDNFTVRQTPAGTGPAYADNFNRATLTGGPYAYTTNVTAGNGGASLTSSDVLTLTNDASSASNAAGAVYVSTPTSAFTGFNTTLNQNSSILTWSFNIRQIRTNPAGFASGNYGAAFILGSTNPTFTGSGAGNGYAVTIGNSGTPDPLKLVKFTGGLTSTTAFVTASQDASTTYWSVKVTYDPATNSWSLFTRSDGSSAFSDPLATTATPYTQAGSAVTDSTYTAVPLTRLGALWNYSTQANQTASFDNFSLAGSGTPSRVEVLVNNVLTYSAPKSVLPSLAFNLGAGDDLLTVDLVNGMPSPAGGLSFDGDHLVILGTPAADAFTLTPTTVSLPTGVISYANATSLTLSGNSGADTFTVNNTSAPTTITSPAATTITLNETASPVTILSPGATVSVNPDNAGSATARFATSQTIASLSIGTGGTASLAPTSATSLTLSSLAISPGGALDLADDILLLPATPTATLRQYLFNQQILTTIPDPNNTHRLGYLPANPTGLYVTRALTADANLDGRVDSDDVALLDLGRAIAGSTWWRGDFDYDGQITDADAALLDHALTA